MKKPFTALLLSLVLLASLRTAGAAGPNGTISVDLYDHAAGRYQSVQADVVTLTLDGAPSPATCPLWCRPDARWCPSVWWPKPWPPRSSGCRKPVR